MEPDRHTVTFTLTLDEIEELAQSHKDAAVRRLARKSLELEAARAPRYHFSFQRFVCIVLFALLCIWSWKHVHMLVRATVRACWFSYLVLRLGKRPCERTIGSVALR